MAEANAGTVLCVDDNQDSLQSMSWLLHLEGFEVLKAASGAEALNLAQRCPDLVILDVNLSDMNGFDVCRQLKAAPETASLPVLMLSGYFIEGRHRIHGLEGGADAYLTKPVEPRELLAHIRSTLRARRAEQAARQAEAKYRGIFENAVEGIFQMTPAGRFLAANPALARMLGYASPAALMALDHGVADLTVDRASLEAFTHRLEERGTQQGFETQLRGKDGTTLWVSLSARAVRDEGGSVAYFEGLVENIQERKQLEEQFLQAQKMEAVGRLAGGMAHDFNNLLTIVYGCAELIQARPGLDEEAQGLLAEIKSAGRRAAALTRQLLTFSRMKPLAPKEIDPNAIIAELEPMLRRLLRDDITLSTSLEAHGRIRADTGQIEQVLMNLAANARDAMPGGGRLLVQSRTLDLEPEDVPNLPALARGHYIVLTVTDTGIGMDEVTRARVFEPFFTTKAIGEGSGLGLATVYGIIHQSGGHVEVQSEIGAGTTFIIYLPRI